jgi:hypothetical protein
LYDLSNKATKEARGDGVGDAQHAENFLAAIRSEDAGVLNQEIGSGHKSTVLCQLGNIAHRVGRLLDCDPETGKVKGDEEAMSHWNRQYEPGWEPKVV